MKRSPWRRGRHLSGKFLRGRLTYAMYRRMHLNTMVATAPQDYVDLAVRIATDPATGQEARKAIRETSGVLYENQADVTAYEEMLRRWCGRT